MEISSQAMPVGPEVNRSNDARIKETSKNLEIAFVTKMLDLAGLDGAGGSFGGGAGEEQFQSFLRNEQARLIVESGGLGLSEHFMKSLARN